MRRPAALLAIVIISTSTLCCHVNGWNTCLTSLTTRMTPRILSHYSPTTPPAATDGLNQRHRLLLDPLQASSTISSNEDDEQQRQKDRRRKLAVGAILASSFLNLLGFTMAGPITPALGKHFGLEVGASFGSLTSAYPLGMLFGLIFWPTLSDKIGRKRIMTLSLFGSALGLAIQSVVIRRDLTLPVFLAARVFTGAFAGSSPVSKAYLADVGYRDGKLPRYLSLRDAASTMAFIVGPMLGGIIYDLRKWFLGVSSTATNLVDTTGSLAFVIGVSSAASLAASLLVGSLVTDVKSKKKRVAGQVNESLGSDEENDEEEIVACPLGQQMWAGVASVCVVSFLFNVGDSTFHAFFSALLRDGARMSAGDIGLLYTLLACISFSVSTTSSGWIMKKWGPVWACAAGLACVGTGLSALGVAAWGGIAAVPASFSVLAAAAAIYYCGVPLYGPTIPTMLLRCVPSSRRGAIMGLDGTINTIARIVSPLFMGDIYRRYGAGAAFGLAGTMVFGGMFTALFRRYIVLRDSFPARTKA